VIILKQHFHATMLVVIDSEEMLESIPGICPHLECACFSTVDALFSVMTTLSFATGALRFTKIDWLAVAGKFLNQPCAEEGMTAHYDLSYCREPINVDILTVGVWRQFDFDARPIL
jgi:hypothetical protein